MKTLDELIAASTEFVCERWGTGEASVLFYAPLTRTGGMTWIHPGWAREYEWGEIRRRATRIWAVSGSLWNPGDFSLIHGAPGLAGAMGAAGTASGPRSDGTREGG